MIAYIRKGIAAVTLGLVLAAKASAAVEIIVTDQSGNYIFDGWLTERPTISFSSKGLSIHSPAAEILLEEVEFNTMPRITFKDNTDGVLTDIAEKPADMLSSALRFQYTDGQTVVIDGIAPNARPDLYSLDGKVMPVDAEQHEMRLTIHLGHLPKGYYIIRIDKKTFKLYKK